MPGQVRPGETAPPRAGAEPALPDHRLGPRRQRQRRAQPSRARRRDEHACTTAPCSTATTSATRCRTMTSPASSSTCGITPLPQSVDELSKLWTAFQTNYRVSAAYEAAVVLIDSQAATRAPLPVLRRGPQDRGVIATASAAPVLDSLSYPRTQTAAAAGRGHRARRSPARPRSDALVRFSSLRLDAPIDIAPLAGDAAGTLRCIWPTRTEDTDCRRRAGRRASIPWRCWCSRRACRRCSSNELPLALAPVITLGALDAPRPATSPEPHLHAAHPRRPAGVPAVRRSAAGADKHEQPGQPAAAHGAGVPADPAWRQAPTPCACASMAPTASRSTSAAACRRSPATSRWS